MNQDSEPIKIFEICKDFLECSKIIKLKLCL